MLGPNRLNILNARSRVGNMGRVSFISGPLKCDHAPFFTKKRSKNAKSNPIFHLKRRRATELGLTDSDSPMAEFLS